MAFAALVFGRKPQKAGGVQACLTKRSDFYGYATWVYRFFLFLAIAILIFYLFPQPLGSIFMLIELGFFIARPIMRELKIWWKERAHVPAKGRRIIGGAVVVLMLVVVFPWRASVEVPAIMQAEAYQKVNAPIAARIDKIIVQHGQRVEKGEPVLVLASDVLDNQIEQVQLELDMLLQQINVTQRDKLLIRERQALVSRQLETQARLNGLMDMRVRLTLRSDMDGQVFYTQDFLHKGLWFAAGDVILDIVNTKQQVLHAYVSERDYGRIQHSATGKFYPDNALHSRLSVTVRDIDTVSTRYLNYPELASYYGGPIAVEDAEENGKLVAHSAIYRLRMMPDENASSLIMPSLRVRGTVVVEGQAESIIYKAFRQIRAVFMREFGI